MNCNSRLFQNCAFGAALLLASLAHAADVRPLRETIDAELAAAWEREKVTPSGQANDAEFLRRIYLDVVGTVPSYDETKAFLADPDSGKRTKLIDKLLGDARYAEAQAAVWDTALFGRDPPGEDATRKRDGWVKFLREQFAKNTTYDALVRQILLAEGNSADQGAPLFLVQFRNKPEDATVAVTRLFLGMQLQCARCHDHPSEPWSQKDFYGMAAFFARLKVVEAGKSGAITKYTIGEANTGDVMFTGPAKDSRPGQKGEPIKAKYFMGAELQEPALPKDYKEPKAESGKPMPKPQFSRKEKLAAWVTSAENPYFAKAAVNRIWAQFMGKGFVDPVDDFAPSSKPSHPALLDAMTEQFKARGFDMKWLIREIVSSRAYGLSSSGASTEANPQWYERARVRPLSAEELLKSVRLATGADRAEKAGAKISITTDYFIRHFGEPTNGRGVFQGSIDEHMFLNNGGDLNRLVSVIKGNLADELSTSSDSMDKKVEKMFLSILSRPPSEAETKQFVAFIEVNDAKDKDAHRKAISQALWVLLNTGEFRFNR